MTLRVLLHSDAAEYHALRLRGLREDPTAFGSSLEEECDLPPETVAGWLAETPQGAILGAFTDGRLVGVVGIQRESKRNYAHKAVLWGMYVAPDARRGGSGRALVEAALAHAFAMPGLRQVNLGVNAANAAAIGLYESCGFTTFGRERDYMIIHGVPQDELHMVRFRSSEAHEPAAQSVPGAGGDRDGGRA